MPLSLRVDAMKRRSKAGGKASKARGREALKTKRRDASKNAPSSASIQGAEVVRLTGELNEAREQETATSQVLHVISSSGDLQAVFATMLENAVRICGAKFANMFLYEDNSFRIVALQNAPLAYAERWRHRPVLSVADNPRNPLARLAAQKVVIDIPDLIAEPAYIERDPRFVTLVELAGARTLLAVPMLRDKELVGAISIYRQEVRPFTDKQIALVTNFAAQAVIAVENARLLNELRQRTADLGEALEQQTATSEVLQVISGSPGDLQPVFAAMLENAARICDANFGNIFRWDGDALWLVATHNTPAAFIEHRRRVPFRPNQGNPIGDMLKANAVIHIADLARDERYIQKRDPEVVAAVELGGIRTFVAVPMLKDEKLIGAVILYRQELRPFTDKQIALVQNFAAQAVIAIENAQLLNELRQRTSDLAEALEQQRATSDLLQVISGSPGHLEPVFQSMLENAVRICGANFGNMFLYDDDAFRTIAMHNAPEAYARARMSGPFHPPSDSALGRVVATKEVAQFADLRTEERYLNRDPFAVVAVEAAGIRTLLAVPMLKEGNLVGAIVIYRQEVLPFTEKQIELVKNFGSQVVIAIENARLLNELRQSLEQQTATSQVLQVISSSSGDLRPVFASILANATRICEADFGVLVLYENAAFQVAATHNAPPAFVELRQRQPMIRASGALGRVVAGKQLVDISDCLEDASYKRGDADFVRFVDLCRVRSLILAPMLKENELIGVIGIYRTEVRPFTDKQIALVQNFAAQAVIAIENARLLKELRERTSQLETQSQELAELNQQLEQRVADQVGEIERMGRLRRFLPPQVADLIVASGSEKQLESHRREITALFCDLRGFTGFTESADAEDVMALLRDYHAAIGEIIIKYNGTLERYAGDGVMVVFNDPVPVENPALQAVLMALEVRDALGALTQTWSRLGHEIGFGIGIAHGFATLGTIGFEGRFDYAAIGTVSNVASRLCDEAKPGQILISPRVLMKVENAVEVEPVGEFELKGIRRPLAAYNVVAASPSGV